MSYAKIINSIVEKYPYTFEDLRADNQQISYPREVNDVWLQQYNIYKIASAPKPAPSSINVNVVEDTPTLVGGVWTQTWKEVPATQQQIAERTKEANNAAAKTAIIADSFVPTFIAMTPAQVSTYINNNVTNLATAKTVIEKLALMVLLLARDKYGD